MSRHRSGQEQSQPSSWPIKRQWSTVLWILAGISVIVIIVIGFIRADNVSTPDSVEATASVPIEGLWLPAEATIGVVITHGSGTTNGAEWADAAEGSVVARERLRLGGTELEFLVRQDNGTEKGSDRAVTELMEQGVSGIIYASAGQHINVGVEKAAQAGVPVILPYTQPSQETAGVWSLAPQETAIKETLNQTLSQVSRPLHIQAEEKLPEGITVADELVFTLDQGTAATAKEVARLTGADLTGSSAYQGSETEEPTAAVGNPVDLVIISGHPVTQAKLVYELQTRSVNVPVLLSPSASSPLFAATLAELGGTVSGNLQTIGIHTGDATAFAKSAQGRSASAFLTALRQFAMDESITNLSDDDAFAAVAGRADMLSHDAVLALAHAISDAGNGAPEKVSQALATLQLSASDALAGPELDFTNSTATRAPAQMLHATGQKLGFRSTVDDDSITLVWFAEDSDH